MGNDEVRLTSATGGQKGSKTARFDLIPPHQLWRLAEHYGFGAAKYSDDNYRHGYDWKLSIAALERHLSLFKQGEDIDEETSSLHLIAVAWHAFTLAEFFDTHPEYDTRLKTVDARAMRAEPTTEGVKPGPTHTVFIRDYAPTTVDSLDAADKAYVWNDSDPYGLRYRWHACQWEMNAKCNPIDNGWIEGDGGSYGPFTRAQKVEETY